MQSSATRPELVLTSAEREVICAVVTKFAADLVLHRLAKPIPKGEAAALEEVATSAAMMLHDGRQPTQVESLAVEAIVESVSTGSEDAFFRALAADHALQLTPARLKRAVRVIHGKMVAGGFRTAA